MTPIEKQFFDECLRVVPRDQCETMWSPATRPSDWDIFWAWMEIRGLTTPLVFIILIAGMFVLLRWKLRGKKSSGTD